MSPGVFSALSPQPEAMTAIDARIITITSIARPDPGNPEDVVSRCFAPRSGIFEDAVCGSAHCQLASYYKRALPPSVTELRGGWINAYQASPRGGELHIRATGDHAQLQGMAQVVYRGRLAAVPPR